MIVPATLRKQWQQELDEKFYLPSTVLEGSSYNRLRNQGQSNPFVQDDKIVICSYHFVSANPIFIRTLRKQVIEYVPYTKRIPITQDFTPSDDEHRLYESVSVFLQRGKLVSLPASQRHLITLVLRKLLASSTFAIAGTLQGLVGRLRSIQRSDNAP